MSGQMRQIKPNFKYPINCYYAQNKTYLYTKIMVEPVQMLM